MQLHSPLSSAPPLLYFVTQLLLWSFPSNRDELLITRLKVFHQTTALLSNFKALKLSNLTHNRRRESRSRVRCKVHRNLRHARREHERAFRRNFSAGHAPQQSECRISPEQNRLRRRRFRGEKQRFFFEVFFQKELSLVSDF